MQEIKIETSKEFRRLYQQMPQDEKIAEIVDGVGITIVRNYDKDTEYFKDKKKMFIRLGLRDNFLIGGIDMVEESKDGLYTIIHENKQYRKRFTNFFFGPEEKITLISKDNKTLVKVQNKEISLNEFIDRLIKKNHLRDRLFWARKRNFLKEIFLKILFFLSDDKYDFVEYYHKIGQLEKNKIHYQEKDQKQELKIKEEPFFKYLKIYKNTLFVFCVISFFGLLFLRAKDILSLEELSLSNPIFLLGFIIILFLLHFFSSYLHRKKEDKNGVIYKIYNSLFSGGNFKLKI